MLRIQTHRVFIFVALFSILPACFAFKQDRAKDIVAPLNIAIVNDAGKICPEILQILELTGIQHDGTLADIVAKTQKAWLRKPGSERWEMETLVTQHDQELKKLFHQLCMYQEVKPGKQHYDYVLMLGALFTRMEQRLAYAVELWKSGVRWNKIVLFAGGRPAVPAQGENLQTFLAFSGKASLDFVPTTETEMFEFIYQYTQMPEDMRQVPLEVIDVPMLQKEDGSLRRPTTADTVEWWLKTKPAFGDCLAISNQPYVFYQHTVFKTLLPDGYNLQTVGTSCKEDENLAYMFDTLARTLYSQLQCMQKVNAA